MDDKDANTEAEVAASASNNTESQPLNVAEDGVAKTKESTPESDKIRMKKELGLLDGVAIILGIIIGSGKAFEILFNLLPQSYYFHLKTRQIANHHDF